MSPGISLADTQVNAQASHEKAAEQASVRPTAILHRVPWRPPVAVSAQGIYVELEDGRRVIDGVGGAAVACIGNGNPEVIKTISDQVNQMAYVYNMQLSNEPAEDLAKYLVDTGHGAFSSCGFVSGGSEAMEAVIKLARQYFYETNQRQRTNFIARKLSYHGNTLGTLALSYHPARRAPYEANLAQNCFHHVSPAYAKRFMHVDETEEEYVERLKKELDDKFMELGPDTVIAFVAETVVGATTGVVPPPKGYIKAMKSVCDKYGALFILDEVMCGMGRMGTLHAWEKYGDGVAPDIQAVAKGLGGGYVPIGAVLMSKQVEDGIRSGSGFWQHGHTYQANPITCAGSLAVQNQINKHDLLQNIEVQGEYLATLLRSALQSPNALAAPYTFDIRGSGGFWGIEFDFWSSSAVEAAISSGIDPTFGGKKFGGLVQAGCLTNGLVIIGMSGGADLEGKLGDHCILAPAYNVTKEEVEKISEIFVKSVESVLEQYRKK